VPDANGNVTKSTKNGLETLYEYDARDQLRKVTMPGGGVVGMDYGTVVTTKIAGSDTNGDVAGIDRERTKKGTGKIEESGTMGDGKEIVT
jgi:YD repeat-containing protein